MWMFVTILLDVAVCGLGGGVEDGVGWGGVGGGGRDGLSRLVGGVAVAELISSAARAICRRSRPTILQAHTCQPMAPVSHHPPV